MGIVCPHCRYENAPEAQTCARCRRTLPTSKTGALSDANWLIDTRKLTPDELKTPLPFPKTSPYEVILKVENVPQPIVLELTPKGVILGRTDLEGRIFPDVDLSPFDAEKCGVSRRHARLSVNTATREVEVADLGSLNGTYVNGQRLDANKPHYLNSGDQVRLGRLLITFFYRS